MNEKLKEQLLNELERAINSIWQNPKYRSERRKMWRTIEAWKEIFNRYIENETDLYQQLILEHYESALSYRTYEAPVEVGLSYIGMLLRGIKYGK